MIEHERKDDLVQVRREDAEWLSSWRERKEGDTVGVPRADAEWLSRWKFKKEEDDTVEISRADAEWISHWRERCETGRLAIKWMWRGVLALLVAAGSAVYLVNQVIEFRGHH